MIVHFSKTMGFLFLFFSLCLGAAAALFLVTGGSSLDLFLAGLLSLAGLMQFIGGIVALTGREYFKVTTNSLVISAVLGPLRKTIQFQSWKDLDVENNKIFLLQEGKRRKIPLSAFQSDKAEWEQFIHQIKQA